MDTAIIIAAGILGAVVGYFFGQANAQRHKAEGGKIRVDILTAHGKIEHGHAIEAPHLGGWEVWCEQGILHAFGRSDGTFPNKTPWNWDRFAFVKEQGVATVHYEVTR
jgi:hypothetical protein